MLKCGVDTVDRYAALHTGLEPFYGRGGWFFVASCTCDLLARDECYCSVLVLLRHEACWVFRHRLKREYLPCVCVRVRVVAGDISQHFSYVHARLRQ